jgi:drug/metabolite transporter (DMT)-like permease
MLLALAVLWGASFMFIKVGVREIPPPAFVCLRFAIAALVLAPVVLLRFGPDTVIADLRAEWRPLFLLGLVNSAVPITSLSWAETRIDSGLAAVLQAAAPLFTLLLALRFSPSDAVGGLRLAGLFLGFGGVILLVGAQPSGNMLAALAVTFSALCYAAGALYGSHRLAHLPPLLTTLGALTAAALALVPLALADPPSQLPGWKVTGSLLALAIGGTAVAYVLYYALFAGAGANRSIQITYLVPAIALVYGVLLLGEPLTVSALAGLALILAGVTLGSGATKGKRWFHPRRLAVISRLRTALLRSSGLGDRANRDAERWGLPCRDVGMRR